MTATTPPMPGTPIPGTPGGTPGSQPPPRPTTHTSRPTQPTGARRRPSPRLFWMLPAGVSLLAGLDAALLLLGLPAPITAKRLPETHGMLLVLGFVATLVSLERATALRRWYGYAAPALLGLSGLLMLIDAVPLQVAKVTLILGTAVGTLVYIPLWRRRYDPQLLVQLLAAGLGLVAAVLWAGGTSMPLLTPWLLSYLVLTIAAERVELAAITMGPNAGWTLLAFAWCVTIALLIGLADMQFGAIALGLALLVLTAWLARGDVAVRTIRATGATRFMAACMLGGYVWLAVAAVTLLFGFPSSQRAYDTVTHAVLLGFVMSMIMAHATTILPAVLHISLPYRSLFWVPAVLLHASLIVRIWVGNALGHREAFVIGGALGIAALVLFVLTAVGSAIAGESKSTRAGGASPRTTRARAADDAATRIGAAADD